MKRNGYAKRGEMPPKEFDRNLCWAINNMLNLLGCSGIVDCQPTSMAGTINVAFGYGLLKKQVHADIRKFAQWIKGLKPDGEASRDMILSMLERKFEQLTNQPHDNQ